jgi:hypothetical protein
VRYRLIGGDELWVIDLESPSRNPVFRLAASDQKHARQLLSNLNKGVRAEKTPTVDGLERRATALSSTP